MTEKSSSDAILFHVDHQYLSAAGCRVHSSKLTAYSITHYSIMDLVNGCLSKEHWWLCWIIFSYFMWCNFQMYQDTSNRLRFCLRKSIFTYTMYIWSLQMKYSDAVISSVGEEYLFFTNVLSGEKHQDSNKLEVGKLLYHLQGQWAQTLRRSDYFL